MSCIGVVMIVYLILQYRCIDLAPCLLNIANNRYFANVTIRSMPYLFYLLLSIICVNGMHGYLLQSQKNERKWSISVHAVKDRQAFNVYILGHVLGGFFFLLFAHAFFVKIHGFYWLFAVSCAMVGFEYLQALLPAKGKTNLPHSLTAYAMWVLFITVGVSSALVLPLAMLKKVVALLLIVIVLAMFVYVHFNRTKLYYYQMLMVLLVSISLFVVAV